MKWDYQTYLNQPDWFIKSIRNKMSIDIQNQNRQMKKINRK